MDGKSNNSGSSSFQIPEELLLKINECSYGGFVLFCFNDHGSPDVYSMVDNDVNAMALQYYIRNWWKTVEEVSIESSKQQLLEPDDEEEEGLL